jgi:hypothetical protein
MKKGVEVSYPPFQAAEQSLPESSSSEQLQSTFITSSSTLSQIIEAPL